MFCNFWQTAHKFHVNTVVWHLEDTNKIAHSVQLGNSVDENDHDRCARQTHWPIQNKF